jgi:hypothetical protein
MMVLLNVLLNTSCARLEPLRLAFLVQVWRVFRIEQMVHFEVGCVLAALQPLDVPRHLRAQAFQPLIQWRTVVVSVV